MPEERENQIERRAPGGISRRSETARRGGDAARFVGGLANRRTQSDLPSTISKNRTYEFSLKWGTEGMGDGQFNAPAGVAVASDGSVYVTDSGNHRIQKFTSEGVFVSKWGTEGEGDGEFRFPAGVAVHPTAASTFQILTTTAFRSSPPKACSSANGARLARAMGSSSTRRALRWHSTAVSTFQII
ncbi:MAG: hypothetical protein COA56_02365 [Dehalococcoidia bacterium]|nr:MAG: hypothetical protein COA56_02365 [Dehalococcoidia bacterium]